jgi:predicted NAD/FAD-binding protein
LDITLRDLLEIEKFSTDFRNWYLLPMGGSIWSTPIAKMLDFPAYTFLQFSMNHGLLQLTDRPQWKTVVGGCRTYVNTALAKVDRKFLNEPVLSIQPKGNGVELATTQREELFDACIICTHPPQTIQMLSGINESVLSVLRSFRYQHNMAVLHTDASILPPKRAWSAWNYTAADDKDGSELVSVSYLINMLQPLPTKKAVVVTLNPSKPINPAQIIKTISYEHPLFDSQAVMAQQRVNELQGTDGIYFAGAWMRYGFHEDGIISAKWAVNKLFENHGNAHLTVDVK